MATKEEVMEVFKFFLEHKINTKGSSYTLGTETAARLTKAWAITQARILHEEGDAEPEE